MSDDLLHKVFEKLGSIDAKQDSMAADIADIKLSVEDYKTMKSKLIGICIGVSAAVGGGLSALFKGLGGDVGDGG